MIKPVCFMFLGLTFLASCKKDEDKSSDRVQGSFGGKTYYLVDAGDLKASEASISGSGSIVFASPLAEISSKDAYTLKFSLQDQGSLELVTHSDGNLDKGMSIAWSRSGTELTTRLKTSDSQSEAKVLEGISAAEDIELITDVHNDEEPAHILIWRGDADAFGEEDALVNSEDGLEAPGNGTGTAWGIVLKKGTLALASLGDPKFVEE